MKRRITLFIAASPLPIALTDGDSSKAFGRLGRALTGRQEKRAR
jgi:hypothetical protein